MIFMIKDEDSVVCKRQCVCKRVTVIADEGLHVRPNRDVPIQLPVENLEEYYSDLYD